MRKEKLVTFEDRGKQLTFKIREMDAVSLESWIIRAIMCLAESGADIPADGGIEGIGRYLRSNGLGALAKIDYSKAKPLLDEMLMCCYRVIDKTLEQVTPESAIAYIEDVKTIFQLRLEALKVNLDFFGGANSSGSPEQKNTVSLNQRSTGSPVRKM